MLTFEQVFDAFAEYLEADTDREIVKVKHGYLSLLWDHSMGDYNSLEFCQTPEELLDELTSNYSGYLEWLACGDKDEPTEAEAEDIRQKAAAIRAKCLNRQE